MVGDPGRIDGTGRLNHKSERQRVTQVESALQIEAVAAATRGAFHYQSFGRRFTANRKIKFIVRSKVAGRHLNDAAVRTVRQIEPGEFHQSGLARIERDLALFDSLIIDLKIHRHSIARAVTEVTNLH